MLPFNRTIVISPVVSKGKGNRMSDSKSNNPTFIVQIKGTANHTWQGVVKWVEEGRQSTFRSALELMQLIDSAAGDNDERADW